MVSKLLNRKEEVPAPLDVDNGPKQRERQPPRGAPSQESLTINQEDKGERILKDFVGVKVFPAPPKTDYFEKLPAYQWLSFPLASIAGVYDTLEIRLGLIGHDYAGDWQRVDYRLKGPNQTQNLEYEWLGGYGSSEAASGLYGISLNCTTDGCTHVFFIKLEIDKLNASGTPAHIELDELVYIPKTGVKESMLKTKPSQMKNFVANPKAFIPLSKSLSLDYGVRIYDMLGNEVGNKDQNHPTPICEENGNLVIDLTSLPAGSYSAYLMKGGRLEDSFLLLKLP